MSDAKPADRENARTGPPAAGAATPPADRPAAGDAERARRSKLNEILTGAELLIEYSSRNALAPVGIDESKLQEIILHMAQARPALTAGGLSEEDEAQFFGDYRLLARAFLPVTVGSILDSRADQSCRRYIWWGAAITPAEASVRRFVVCSFAALVALLAVQIFWLVGFDLFDRLRVLEKERVAAQPGLTQAAAAVKVAQEGVDKALMENAAKSEAAKSEAAPERRSPDGSVQTPPAAVSKNSEASQALAAVGAAKAMQERAQKALEDLLTEGENRAVRTATAMGLLTRWTDFFRWAFPSNDSSATGSAKAKKSGDAPGTPVSEKPVDNFVIPLAAANTPSADDKAPAGPGEGLESEAIANQQAYVVVSIAVNVLQTYVLPLLYGFLGTCAYVLRQLTIEIRNRTFRREMELSYWLRIFLGVLAGLAVGWFLRPEPDKDGLIRGLTPFALSFLAGYSVEVLFSGMDKLVSAFGSTSQQSKG